VTDKETMFKEIVFEKIINHIVLTSDGEPAEEIEYGLLFGTEHYSFEKLKELHVNYRVLIDLPKFPTYKSNKVNEKTPATLAKKEDGDE
jgi:hypothetical protein